MIFQHTWEQVLQGCKIESRRPWKDGYWIARSGNVTTLWDGKRVKLRTGQVRAMQPGRGKPAIARIRIEAIWCCEDVRLISWQSAKAEGFGDEFGKNALAFLKTWCSMHDRMARIKTWDDLFNRPDELYRAYAFRFSLVKAAFQPMPLPRPEQLRLMG